MILMDLDYWLARTKLSRKFSNPRKASMQPSRSLTARTSEIAAAIHLRATRQHFFYQSFTWALVDRARTRPIHHAETHLACCHRMGEISPEERPLIWAWMCCALTLDSTAELNRAKANMEQLLPQRTSTTLDTMSANRHMDHLVPVGSTKVPQCRD